MPDDKQLLRGAIKPSIGSIVHFVSHNPDPSRQPREKVHVPAIVTAVHDKARLDLEVFGDPQFRAVTICEQDGGADPRPQGWHWPEPDSDGD